MKRLLALCVSLELLLLIAVAPALASSKPTIRQVASIVAGHKQAIESDAQAQADCLNGVSSDPLCVGATGTYNRAIPASKNNLALAKELERAVGKKAKNAPAEIRALTQATIKQARAVYNGITAWIACARAHNDQATSCESLLTFLDTIAAWPALLDRWSPYLG